MAPLGDLSTTSMGTEGTADCLFGGGGVVLALDTASPSLSSSGVGYDHHYYW